MKIPDQKTPKPNIKEKNCFFFPSAQLYVTWPHSSFLFFFFYKIQTFVKGVQNGVSKGQLKQVEEKFEIEEDKVETNLYEKLRVL